MKKRQVLLCIAISGSLLCGCSFPQGEDQISLSSTEENFNSTVDTTEQTSSEQEATKPEYDGPLYNINWDNYQPKPERSSNLPEEKYTRLSDDTISEYKAGSSSGDIYPFLDRIIGGSDWEESCDYLRGFVDSTGKIVCDGVYMNVFQMSGVNSSFWQCETRDKLDLISFDGKTVINTESTYDKAFGTSDGYIFNYSPMIEYGYTENDEYEVEAHYKGKVYDAKGNIIKDNIKIDFTIENAPLYMMVDSMEGNLWMVDFYKNRYLVLGYWNRLEEFQDDMPVKRIMIYDTATKKFVNAAGNYHITDDYQGNDDNNYVLVEDPDCGSYFIETYGDIDRIDGYENNFTQLKKHETGEILFSYNAKIINLGE